MEMRRKSKGVVERKIRGYKSALKGLDFERKVMEYLSKKGYTIKSSRKRTKAYGEIDIIAFKEGWFFNPDEYLVVECKDKDRVTLNDFVKFVAKLRRYASRKRDADVYGLFAYRGKLDPQIKEYIQTLDRALRNSITIKKFR